MPELIELDFVLSDTPPPLNTLFCFPNLYHLTLHSDYPGPVSRLLSQTQLPVITEFSAEIAACLSKEQLSAFWAGFQASITGSALRSFTLNQSSCLPNFIIRLETHPLGLEDLRPCKDFRNLRCLQFDLEWNVGLKESELLALASAWPHLEDLSINSHSGWDMPGGITPNGLLQLFQKCQSISHIAIVIDTRGYTEPPTIGLLESLGWTARLISVNVLNSAIEAESVQALAAFFARKGSSVVAIHSELTKSSPGLEVYEKRWDEVDKRAWPHRAGQHS